MGKLGSFDGNDVVGTRIAVTNAGDGLSKAMKTEPRVMNIGEKVFVVLECEVTKVGFVEVTDAAGEVVRTHTLRAGTASFIDEEDVREKIAEQAERNRKLADEAKGVRSIGDWAGDIEELRAQHESGAHEGVTVPGCPVCNPDATTVTPISGRRKRSAEANAEG